MIGGRFQIDMLYIFVAVLAGSAIALPPGGHRQQHGPKRIIIDTDLLDFVSLSRKILGTC